MSRGDKPSRECTINGLTVVLDAEPFTPLSAVLRDTLGLTGTKVGCEAGDCGACTVLVDDAAACACLVPAGQLDGARIETIEGGAAGGVRDRLRRAFLAHGAAQCGICTPGMIMAAAALLKGTPAPTRAQITDGIGGVLCRCTGYIKIIEAIAAVACPHSRCADSPPPGGEGSGVGGATHVGIGAPPLPASPTRGEGENIGLVGRRLARVDGEAKVGGTELFGADWAPADSWWMRVVRSPHASATFALGDLDSVRCAHPGLAAILTSADVPGENAFGIFANTRDQPVLAERHVRFRGEAVLALVGTRAAIETIEDTALPITWTPTPALSGIDAALAPGAAALHASAPDNVLTRGLLVRGDVHSARSGAAVSAHCAITTRFVEHAYIEPEAGFAIPDADGPGTMTVSACTQAPYMDRDETARVLGVAPEAVRIVPTACGGGFGGKLDVSVQPLLAIAARRTGRPVRIVYTRAESMASTTKRHPARIAARASADRDGRLIAYEMTGDFNTGAYASWGPTVANRVPIHASGPYRVAAVANRTRAIYTNDTPAGAFRGFGVPQAALAHEQLMDDLADQLGLDRWLIRRRNALGRGDTTASGQLLAHSAGLPECLDALGPAWDAALLRAAQFNAASTRLKRGAGIACMWYGCGNTSLPNPSTMRITLARDGRLTLWNGAVDIGQGSSTVLVQIAAEALGVLPETFTLVTGDTALTPDAGKTSASRQTFVSGRAVALAAAEMRSKVLALANAGPAARISLDGVTLCIDDGDAGRRIDLAALPGDGDIVLEAAATYDPPTTPLDRDGQGAPYATYGFAAQIAEVEVDTALGLTRVLHIHAAHDVGRAINPTLTEGQIHGGIAQGLGLALMEEFVPGRTENLHDYLIPTAGDMPPVTIHLIEDPEPEGPFGAKGVGEPALVATAPAILSAIRHATGVTLSEVPVLPHRLWAALRKAEGPR